MIRSGDLEFLWMHQARKIEFPTGPHCGKEVKSTEECLKFVFYVFAAEY